MMIHKASMMRGDKGVSRQPGSNSSEALSILNSRRVGMRWSLKCVTERKALCKELWLIDQSSVSRKLTGRGSFQAGRAPGGYRFSKSKPAVRNKRWQVCWKVAKGDCLLAVLAG